jgi:L-asparaginase II
VTNPTEPVRFGPLPPPGAAPFTVAARRGGSVESSHLVAAAIVDNQGGIVGRWGDIERPVYPRSAIKPLQAIALVESGAADRFNLSDAELALACASHDGRPEPVAIVAAWLARIGLRVDDLECGSHWPFHEPSARAMAVRGERPCPLHNNCSGKHAGMLTTALHLGDAPDGYVRGDHPVQVRVNAAIAEICAQPLGHMPHGIDGCSIPTVAMPLRALAFGMARFASPDGLAVARADACHRLGQAMAAFPTMIAGPGLLATELILATGGEVLAKNGAEGVFAAALPGSGLGIALKVADGASRAADVAISALLDHVGALDSQARAAVASLARPSIATRRGVAVGEVAI